MLAAVPGRGVGGWGGKASPKQGSGGELGAGWCARMRARGCRGPGRAHLGEVEGCDDPPEPVAESLEQAETHQQADG